MVHRAFIKVVSIVHLFPGVFEGSIEGFTV